MADRNVYIEREPRERSSGNLGAFFMGIIVVIALVAIWIFASTSVDTTGGSATGAGEGDSTTITIQTDEAAPADGASAEPSGQQAAPVDDGQ
ncbi:hypothetical protein [Mesobacterium pallidum]|uniref:hypothetical protein n=1 Tax=Mesobacterium pallidum TaxID=2872037 RepID=UPI001EE3002C|nr:hypothetical protein [Mesobacterium pallidum]